MCKCCKQEESKVTLNTSYRHMQFTDPETDKGLGGITALIVLDKSELIVHFAYAFCVPTDRFCKAEGRRVAEEAFMNDKFVTFVLNPDHPVFGIKQQIDRLVFDAALTAYDFEINPWPRWYRKVVSKERRLEQLFLKDYEII